MSHASHGDSSDPMTLAEPAPADAALTGAGWREDFRLAALVLHVAAPLLSAAAP